MIFPVILILVVIYISEMHNVAFCNDTAEIHVFGCCENSRFHVRDIYTLKA